MKVWIAASVAAGAVSGSLAGQTAAASTPKVCSNVNGVSYSYTAVGGAPLKGSHYRVQEVGVSCSVAELWASKLTARTPGATQPDGGNLLSGGPAGFKCEGKSYTYAPRASDDQRRLLAGEPRQPGEGDLLDDCACGRMRRPSGVCRSAPLTER